jgi:hypothetical protein
MPKGSWVAGKTTWNWLEWKFVSHAETSRALSSTPRAYFRPNYGVIAVPDARGRWFPGGNGNLIQLHHNAAFLHSPSAFDAHTGKFFTPLPQASLCLSDSYEPAVLFCFAIQSLPTRVLTGPAQGTDRYKHS